MKLSVILVAAGLLWAAPSPAAMPKFSNVRYDEDYSSLAGRPTLGLWERLKHIPFGRARGVYLSLGGELRERYEYASSVNWGAGTLDANGHWLHRAMLHADLHLTPSLRAFGQLKSGVVHGREGGPRPTDEDRLDLNQAFVDLATPDGRLMARTGRQEFSFGSARLISNREAPNVHLTFDAARLSARFGGWQVDGFGSRPVETIVGVFDDHSDKMRSLWGLYGVRGASEDGGLSTDLYYLRYANDAARFDVGIARELRHSAGTRLWNKGRPLDYNFEVVYQWGRFGTSLIQAWTFASDTGYTAKGLPGWPRFGLRADVTSGDRDPADGKLETFNALFPRGSYFGEIALIGPYNHVDAHPEVRWQLPRDFTVSLECDFFWRYSLRDGIYNPAGTLIRTGQRSRARYVGTQPAVQGEWKASRFLTLTANYTRFFAGPFLKETPPGRDINYVSTWATFKF